MGGVNQFSDFPFKLQLLQKLPKIKIFRSDDSISACCCLVYLPLFFLALSLRDAAYEQQNGVFSAVIKNLVQGTHLDKLYD
jgi:hypothetical protein